MTAELRAHLDDYLRLRRGLGFTLARDGLVLAQFLHYLRQQGSTSITIEAAIAFALLPRNVDSVNWSHRLGAIRGFARYLATIDPATEIPPTGVFPGQGRRPAPYVYTDAEIQRILHAANDLRPAMHAATIHTLLGLLAVTGLRIGEALPLRRSDVDLRAGVLTVAGRKAGHPRLVPLHPSTTEQLRRYARRRDRRIPSPRRSETFFVSTTGTALRYSSVREAFIEITTTIGLRTAMVLPRVHDLRHAFTVSCLLDWYRSGVDVAAMMPVLSTYLGHVNPASTYWYLTATPELMGLAAQRLQASRPGSRR